MPLKLRNYPNFLEAKKIVKKININSGREYRGFVRNKKNQFPNKPSEYYKKEWKGWGDFLGTGKIADQNLIFKSYQEAKKIIFKFKIQNVKEYRKFVKTKKFQKLNIPKHPNQTYTRQNKWKGWGDFLGTGNIYKGNYWSFFKARRFVRKLKLNSVRES